MTYKSPLRTAALIIFCLMLAIILREIVRAETMDPEPVPEYEVITYEEYLATYEPSESPTIDFDVEVKEQVGEIEELLTVKESVAAVYKVTAYCPCPKCCGEWSDGFTYTGDLAHEGTTIAVDPEVIPLGTIVYIEGVGERIAQDIGGAIDGNDIDLFFYSHEAALAFGIQYLEVTVVDSN